MKLLHSADWHLDAPLVGLSPQQAAQLRGQLQQLPQVVAELCRREGCDLVLLSGDLFDGPATPASVEALKQALRLMAVPVFIAPGNHDPIGTGPWLSEQWPENVHIFTQTTPQSVAPEGLSCRVWGAAFQQEHAPSLLEGFRAQGDERYAVGVFHGDATQKNSPYSPITGQQVRESGLDYLALGHIHKGDSFRAGDTLCAWPGCPMGRGFDELGDKGVLIITLDDGCTARFVSLGMPRFHWLQAEPQTLDSVLPPVASPDHYRVELTGEWEAPDTDGLYRQFSHLPNLTLVDRTVPPLPLWENAGDDTLEGVYFALLRDADAPREVRELAARLSRRILRGEEVSL